MINPARRNAVKYIIKLLIQLTLSAMQYFATAGSWRISRGIVYFSVYLTISLIGSALLLHYNPETLSARNGIAPNTKGWDKVFLLLYIPLAYFGMYIAAGLPFRFAEAYPPEVFFWIGICITILASFLTVWSVHANRHFESSARIQLEREHSVCSSGPYAFVRHPGYTAIIAWVVAMPLMFGWYAGIVSVAIIVLVTIRTILEDAMLQQGLREYKEYSEKVRYRLFPLIW